MKKLFNIGNQDKLWCFVRNGKIFNNRKRITDKILINVNVLNRNKNEVYYHKTKLEFQQMPDERFWLVLSTKWIGRFIFVKYFLQGKRYNLRVIR